MANADRIGSQTIGLNSEEIETNLQTGNKTTFTYEGSRADMVSQRLVEQLQGASFLKLVSRGDGIYQLIATYNYDKLTGGGSNAEPPANVHDLEVSMDTVSAYSSPKLHASLFAVLGSNSAVENALATVSKAVDFFRNGDSTINVAGNSPQAKIDAEAKITSVYTSYPTAQALMLSLFRNVALLGQEVVPQFNSVYRRSITAATPGQVIASRTGEDMIWTSAEISAFENLPSLWWFGLPTGLQWLKTPCNVNLVAGGKTRVDYTYIASKIASGLFFDAYNSAVLLP